MVIQTLDTLPSDAELLVGIARHDEASLAALFDRYNRLAFSLALRVVNDRGRAEDVVQDAFLSVWRKAGTFAEGRGSVKTWVTSIVRNRAIDLVRARRESDADDESVLMALRDGAPDVLEQVTAGLDRDLVRAAVQALPIEQQRAISMAYFEGRSHSEIAELTGLPLGTVKSRIRLAMSRLRDALVLAQIELPTPAWTEAHVLFSASDAAAVVQP